ncbi:DUF1357 family protein (plasmid) [Borrelia sp. A-FGy1]|uniref:DUF1357 family protein n=1 Tax=Borrelia sp. A-FGy1 TaxID=2608247 RepID=UPI0015F3B981|nr:DUF1357 family protein [Borrelia sp. A-FGy1]QMU99829.1 DUF1357 family protein [Borrelia sp. A-FGy1]
MDKTSEVTSPKSLADEANTISKKDREAFSISKEEYQNLIDTISALRDEFRISKSSINEGGSELPRLSIDEQVAREIAANKKHEITQKELADKAKFISEVDKLAQKNLAPNFNTEKLERQNYTTDEILDAQIKALIKKYVPEGTILAIAGTSDLGKINMGSKLLGQLFRVAKDNIKKRKSEDNSYRTLYNTLTAHHSGEIKSFQNNGENIISEDDFKYANVNHWKESREKLQNKVS